MKRIPARGFVIVILVFFVLGACLAPPTPVSPPTVPPTPIPLLLGNYELFPPEDLRADLDEFSCWVGTPKPIPKTFQA
jgi:hypothetical protein